MATIRLVSFTPICFTTKGLRVVTLNNNFSYLDGSIRPEPSLEQEFPGISSLCRGSKLAPRLKKEDIIIYVTKKGYY